MKILFLGTGAADWQKEKNSQLFRRNSSVLIDEKLLIDPGPGVVSAIEEYGVDVSKIEFILNTHPHDDHFNKKTLSYLEKRGACLLSAEADKEIRFGGYKVKVLRANHSIEAVHFLITSGKKRMFYGLDGAWLMYDEVKAIKEKGVDFAVFDATIGNIEGDYRIFEHNNLNMVIEMKKSLEKYIDRFCISHMAKTLHGDHESLAEQMKKYDIEVAFDGFETEF